ncbi:MAG: MFS transporter [Corynebacterium flavescens]|nr:MFS transporter [Corynebacterium flavescens]
MSTQNSPQNPTIPREICVMVTAAFIIALGYGLIAPLLPQFIVSFDVSMAAAGMVISVFSATRLIFAPSAGALVDRIGNRKIYLIGLLTVATATGAVSVAQEYWQVVALRGLAGLGSTMFTVSAMGLIVKLSPPTIRGKCSATYATAFLLGNVVGPVLGASLSFSGFRWPFFIYGVAVAIAACVVWALMPKVDHAEEVAHELPHMHLKEAWQDVAFRAVLTSNFAQCWINLGVRVSVLPLFAASVFHNGAAAAGFALAVFAAGNAAVLQFSGRWADTYGRRPLVMIGLTGTAVFMGVLGFADSVWSLILVSALAGASSGLINPAQQAVVADVVGNKRSGGQVLSAFQMGGDLGQICGPILVGFLADVYGFKVAFAICGVVALMGIIAWAFARETLKSHRAIIRRIPKDEHKDGYKDEHEKDKEDSKEDSE